MPYQIAIIDDNPIEVQYTAALVKRWAEGNSVSVHVETFLSAEAFWFRYEEDTHWDVLLLDIEMPGQNGVELAKVIRRTNAFVQLVFLTGFPDYIAEGYDVSALHYLMKPVWEEKLYEVLDRAVSNLVKSEKRLAVTFDRQTDYIPLNQIYYIEAQKQYVAIYAKEQTYRMKTSLSETEKLLDDYFFKCHRSFVVNLRYVKRILPDCVLLNTDERVPISRGMAAKIGKEIIRLF